MKKSMIFVALATVACGLLSSSCAKTEMNKPSDGTNNTLTVSLAPTGKTSLAGTDVVWNEDDQIRAFGDKDSYVSTSITIKGKGNQADFTFDAGETLKYACYPADACTECSNGTFKFTMPTSQQALAGSFGKGANFAAGAVIGSDVAMKNGGALLSVDVKNDNIISIAVSAEGIAGDAQLTLKGTEVESITSGTGDMVRMSGTFEKGKTYYFTVLPGNYGTITLRFANAEGKTATFVNNKGLEITRNSNTVLFDAEIPAGKWSDEPDFLKYGKDYVLPGTAYGVEIEGVFLEGSDKVYCSFNGGAKTLKDASMVKLTADKISIYNHRDDIGAKVQYFLKRGEKYFELTDNLNVAKPEVAQGYIPDDVFLAKLKTCNDGICAKYFDICDMVDLEMANTYNIFTETNYLGMTDGLWESVEGLELFNAWSASKWSNADVRMWNSKNLVNVDLSKWKARTAIRLTSSAKVEKVIFGPNMFGGPVGGAKFRIVDASLCEKFQYVDMYDNDVPLLELLDLRTGNYIGGNGMNLSKLPTVTDASKLTIRIKADFYLKHTYANAWQNGIYKAWQKGATVEVYKTDDRTVRLGSVTPYILDPDALPAENEYKEGKNWYWGGPDYTVYSGKTVKPGTGKGLGITSAGTFELTDKVYWSLNGAEASELDSKFYSVTTSELRVYVHRENIGKKVQYWIVREGKKYPLSTQIDVVAPTVAEGYIPDAKFLEALKTCSGGACAQYIDVCDIVDVEKANTVNVFVGGITNLGLTDLTASSIEGIELFNAWTGADWDKADVRMWSSPNLVNVNLSKWKARTYIRLTNCDKLESVKLGANMFGGAFGGPKLKTVDAMACEQITALNIEENDVPSLQLLDLRTRNCLSGIYIPLMKLTTVSNPSGLVIRIKEDFYKLHTVANAWQNGIYAAWKKGAVIEVYDNDEINYKLGTCPSYASNPNALPAGEKYIEGTNWDCGAVKYACESYDVAIAEANKAYARYTAWKGSDETIIFPIVTDIHATGVSGNKQFREVVYTDEVFHYDFIAHLGDIATANKLTKAIIDNTAAQQNNYKGIVIFTPGNHDWDNDWNDPDNKYHISATKMSETFQVPSKSRPGGENIHIANGKCYGYYDIPSKNFRIFFLDSFGNTESGTSIRWNDEQLQWLMGELAKTPEGYNIVFISHVMPHDSGKWASNTWPPEWKTPSYRIRPMLEDFINRRKGQDGNVSWNFTSAQGKIVGFITGDTHVDWLGKEDGLNLFISQGAGFMGAAEMKPEHQYESFNWTTNGTFFSHVIAIKPGKGEVKAFRIGAKGDASFDYSWTY